MLIAYTREVSPALADCELTHLEREPLHVAGARAEHEAYGGTEHCPPRARSLAPENTLLAARRGLEAGADLWETDLAVTRDEALILFHDDRLVRTTDVQQRFPDRAQDPFTTFSLAEIRTLDAGTWFVETDPHGQITAGVLSDTEQQACKGLQVPTLEEALVFTRDAGWKLNLELKFLPAPLADFPVVPQVLAMIDRVGIGAEQILISSFNHAWLTEVRDRRPALEIQALVGYYTYRPLDWGDLAFIATMPGIP